VLDEVATGILREEWEAEMGGSGSGPREE
jgi:hypothetical protein